jgi:predicted NBD/HSP70 family sugar kinase
MQTGSNLEKAKIYNERLVLDLIRMHGSLSRSELARITALTPPTVSNIINSLSRQGLVFETGRAKGPRGSPSTLFSLNPAGALSIGINLDRDHAGGVLLDLAGQVVAESEREIDLADQLGAREAVRRLLDDLTGDPRFLLDRLLGVGIGLPTAGGLYLQLTEELKEDAAEVLQDSETGAERVSVPIYIENNANAAGLGEYWYGDASSYSSFFYLLFGLGLGGGVVLQGNVYRGAGDFAGELGRVPIINTGAGDGSGAAQLVLEDVASLKALYEALQLPESLGLQERSRAAGELATSKDPRFLSWLELASTHLARALIHVECLLDPEAFVFGGRLPTSVLEPLAAGVRERMAELRRLTRKPSAAQVVEGRAGSRAGSLGVGVLPLYETIAPKHDLLQKTPLKVETIPTPTPTAVGVAQNRGRDG